MYGLTQSVGLAYIELINYLQLHGYTRACFTPGLFKYARQYTLLSLGVDDFGTKYTAKNDAMHLIDTPKKKKLASLLIGVPDFFPH